MILKISGGTSSLELFENYLVISPSNIQKMSGASKTIPLDSVVTVSIERPFLKTPYLQVITPGMVQQKNDAMKGSNANVVLIQPGNMAKAKRVQEYVMQYKAGNRQGIPVAKVSDDLVALEKLDELRKKGIITQAEFEAKKKQLLKL